MAAHSDGLVLLTDTVEGALSRLLLAERSHDADTLLKRLAGYFPDRLYVELTRHGLASEHAVEEGLIALAESHQLPLLASNDVYFAEPDDFAAHEVLLAIGQGMTISQPQRRRLIPNHPLHPANDRRFRIMQDGDAHENERLPQRLRNRAADLLSPLRQFL